MQIYSNLVARYLGERLGPCVLQRPEKIVGVDDRVRVALFGEEPLAVRRVLRVEGVASDDGVEVRLPTVLLRAQHATQPLRLFLARSEGPADLHGDRGLG